jgi:hypothetical protein
MCRPFLIVYMSRPEIALHKHVTIWKPDHTKREHRKIIQ